VSTSPIAISVNMMYNKSMRKLKKKPIQIYIEPEQDAILEVLSKNNHRSKASLIRESIEYYVANLPAEEDAVMNIIGLGASKRGDISHKHDTCLNTYHHKIKNRTCKK